MFNLFNLFQEEEEPFRCPHCGATSFTEELPTSEGSVQPRKVVHEVRRGTWRDIPAAMHTLIHDTKWSDLW